MNQDKKNDFKAFGQFITFPLHISAYTNEKGQVKKSCSSLPNNWIGLDKSNKTPFVYKKDVGMVKPNGIGVICRDISVIDIDQPSNCSILDQLKADCGFWVKTKNGFHFYFAKEETLPRQSCCKIADINVNLLYYCPTYIHDETGEEYHYELMKSEPKLVVMPKYAIDWCKMLISMRDDKTPSASGDKLQKVKRTNEEKIVKNPDIIIEKFDLKTMEDIFNIFHIANGFAYYDGWRDIAYMARHLNNTEKAFKLFDKYARMCPEYKTTPEIENRKMYFGKGEYNENFDENGVLIKCSKLNPEKFKTTLQYLYKSKWDDELIKMNFKYIYPDGGENDDLYDEWNKKYKCLGIKSAYGTGKTYGFKKLIDKYKYKKVLFITYRQSLAFNFSIELSERFGFVSYLDVEQGDLLTADRLIIQLDSIKRLNGGFNYITQQDGMPKYDLIILDEIEGMLNHMSFEKIDQFTTHNFLTRLIKKAPKILALDGDMSDRSFDFLSELCPTYKFYQNEYKPNKKNFLFSHNLASFNAKIRADLQAGHKIVVVSMTKSDTERLLFEYSDKYGDGKRITNKYKVCIHNSIERNKDILKKANEEWAKCDLLLYSPSVESGVDFNIENYFYKCYAILNAQSTSYRAFNQMLNRVRHYISDEVLCLMPMSMEYRVNEILYRFDEMSLTKYNGIERTNLVDILIHNDTERINSTNYFICSLINALNTKGHTHKYLADKPEEKQKNKISVRENTIACITDATNIDGETYEQYCNLQKQNKELTRTQYYEVQKQYYARVFKVKPEDINEDWLEERLDKCEVPKNWNRLNLPTELRVAPVDTDYLTNFVWERVDKVKNLLSCLGVKIEGDEIKVESKKEYEATEDSILKFVSDKKFKTLFNNGRVVKKLNVLKVLNETINDYGVEVLKKKIVGARDAEGKQTYTYEHETHLVSFMPEYIEVKKQRAKERDEKLKQQQLAQAFLDDDIEI